MDDRNLTASEKEELEKLCSLVDSGLAGFLLVGSALSQIKEKRLYRQTHDTFEQFVKDKWKIGNSRAYQLIDAAKVSKEISTIVEETGLEIELNTESQLRELNQVGTESLPEVLEKIAEECKAQNKKPSATIVKDVVRKALGKDKDPLGREVKHLDLARKHLSGLRLALSNLGAGKRFDEYWANVEDWLNG